MIRSSFISWFIAIRRAGLGAAVAALACGLTACPARNKTSAPADSPRPAVSVVLPAPPAANRALWEKILRESFPDAVWYPVEEMGKALSRQPVDRRLLILPDARYLPTAEWKALQNFLNQGGSLLLAGRDPFLARLTRTNKGWQDEQESLHDLLVSARKMESGSSMRSWNHLNHSGIMRGAVRLAGSRKIPWDAIRVEIEAFALWDVMQSPDLPPGAVQVGENGLAFYARGDADTTRLVVECETRSGVRWFCVVPISTAWESRVLRQEQFRLTEAVESPAPPESLTLTEIQSIRIGLNNRFDVQRPGTHVFEVSDVRLVRDQRSADEAVAWPEAFLVANPDYRFDFAARELRPLPSAPPFRMTQLVTMQSPRRMNLGGGGARGSAARWIPLAEAVDEDGRITGWPASLFLDFSGSGLPRMWSWIGLDPTAEDADTLKNLLRSCADRLRNGWFLYQSGCDRFSFSPREPLVISTRWRPGFLADKQARVAAELLDNTGYVQRRVVSPPLAASDAAVPVRLELGLTPVPKSEPSDLVIRILLEDATGRTRIYDSLEQPIQIQNPPAAPPGEQWLVATGPRFTSYKRPVFLLGLVYVPQLVAPGAIPRAPGFWLEPDFFTPTRIRQELDELKKQSVNAVSIQLSGEDQVPQLEFFLNEAARREIWVHLGLDALSPLTFDAERAQRLLEAAHLRNRAGVFAIDLADLKRLDRYADRVVLDTDWETWLREQYGTMDQAEKIFGTPLWVKDGKITGPPDEVLGTDGPHRAAAAAYRRFVDDWISHRMGYIVRTLRSWGIRQMICRRTDFFGREIRSPGPSFLSDPWSGSVHLDFIALGGKNLTGHLSDVFESGFITAYGRGMGDGKPVAWFDLEAPVGPQPRETDLENQAARLDILFDTMLRSYAAGCFVRSVPGLLSDGFDTSILTPASLWRRPAADSFPKFSSRWRREKALPRVWKGREIDRFADARGWYALWEKWKNTYRKEIQDGNLEELRPSGFARLTTELTPLGLGGVPFSDPSPMESVNAEWGRIQIDGVEYFRKPGETLHARLRQTLRLELINTGPASWAFSQPGREGTVWIQVNQSDRKTQFLEIATVSFGHRTWITWVASDPGPCTLRPLLLGTGGFGESLQVEVQ